MSDLQQSKKCTRCGQVKATSEFYRGGPRNLYGVIATCKVCKSEQYLERARAQGKAPRRDGRDAERKRAADAARRRALREELADKARERMAALRSTQEGRAAQNAAVREYKARKRVNDPSFVVNARVSRAILKAIGVAKAGRRWEALVGYGLHDLVEHLARQLPVGVALSEMGSSGWHIDHIVPLSSFDTSTLEGLRAAWALSNLRPVRASVNLSKGARRLYLI